MTPNMAPVSSAYPPRKTWMKESGEAKILHGRHSALRASERRAPQRYVIFSGQRLAMSLPGDTMFATTFTSSTPTIMHTPTGMAKPGGWPYRIGAKSHTTAPVFTKLEAATSMPQATMSTKETGKPRAWPTTWARWLLLKRERSTMLRTRVDQVDTIALTPLPHGNTTAAAPASPVPSCAMAANDSRGGASSNAITTRPTRPPTSITVVTFKSGPRRCMPISRTSRCSSRKPTKMPSWAQLRYSLTRGLSRMEGAAVATL
mmetsp:Transcript_25173/g.70561  ORF Transcript_25173/g.70561 Transcript_25173/m.70561 type:complete len:260 (+) Transcript_25173:744-1523(+)